MKNSVILFGAALAALPCAHADVLPVPAPLDIVLILVILAVAVLICVGVVFVLYKLYRRLWPKKNLPEKKIIQAKKKAPKKK